MRRPAPFLWLASLTALCLFAGACEQTPQQRAAANLKQEWKRQAIQEMQEARQKHFSPKGGFYEGQVARLKKLLSKTPTEVVEAELQRICRKSVPDFSTDDTEFDRNYDNVLMNALFLRVLDQKDAPHLTTLLNHHCPRYLMYSSLEFWLANRWPSSIEHLFDCYTTAESPAVRKDIAFCLRRAFPAIDGRFRADDEFVKQAQSWYVANRSRLQVNHNYIYVVAQPGPLPEEDGTNLFVHAP